MLITINVDNVGTISNVYWSDSIFFEGLNGVVAFTVNG